MRKRVLITGGFGYLGGRIALGIAQHPGWAVRLGSRTARKTPEWLSQAETVVMDVLDPNTLVKAVQDVDVVIHLAAMNENQCLVDPNMAVMVNTLGTLNMLQAADAEGVERFIFLSTAHVYGAPLIGQIDEQVLARPIHPYAITHHAAEDFVLAFHDQQKISGLVIRLSNAFGAPVHPRVDRWTLLVNDLCRQAVQTRRLVLRSSGIQQRDFISLTDVVRAVLHLLILPQKQCADGLFNLGGEAPLSIWYMTRRIATRCQVVLGYTPEIFRPVPRSNENTNELDYNINKLKQTGFHLSGNLDEEIDQLLLFCRDSFGVK